MKDNRIQEYRFATVTSSGPPGAAGVTTYTFQSDSSLNGEVLSVDWKATTIGSLYIVMSGTGVEIFRRNAPSGTNWQHANPTEFGQITTGSVTAATMRSFVLNEPIILKLDAGSNTAISGLNYGAVVKYR